MATLRKSYLIPVLAIFCASHPLFAQSLGSPTLAADCDALIARGIDNQNEIKNILMRAPYCGERGFATIAAIVRAARTYEFTQHMEVLYFASRAIETSVHEALIETAEDRSHSEEIRFAALRAAMISVGAARISLKPSADPASRKYDCVYSSPITARVIRSLDSGVRLRALDRVRAIESEAGAGEELRELATCASFYLRAVTGAPYPFDASKITARHVCGNEFLVRNDNPEGTVGLTYDLDGGRNPGVVTLSGGMEEIARKFAPGPMRLFYKDQLIIEVARTGGPCPPRESVRRP